MWGTVIAHQSLSLHFLFHHRHHTGQESRFARLFMQVLQSVRPGGRFCYTPALPFFEEVLEQQGRYGIRRYPHASAPAALGELASATHLLC